MTATISLQLYTVREALSADPDATLGRIADIGFTAVELYGLQEFGDAYAAGLAKHGLAAPSTHVPLATGELEASFALAEKLGLDPVKMFDIVAKSSGQSWSTTTYYPWPGPVPTSPANRNYDGGFATAMMLKDLKLAQDAAAKSGASTPLGAQAEALYQLFDGLGYGGRDFSGILQMLRGKLDDLPKT